MDMLWLVWLGITPPIYAAVDYFPLFPWFGLVLIGVGVGNTVYQPNGRIFSLPDLSGWFPLNLLQLLGQWSLPIYVVHQPLLIGILFALGLVSL